MKVGDLVEIYFGDVPNETAVYIAMDYNSAWTDGEEENYSRAMVLWDDSITSIPVRCLEVISGN
jgi:hypothetical protein